MRLYVPAALQDLRRLEDEGRLPDDGSLVAFAVTPWVMSELGVVDPEDETAEYAVLRAAAEQQVHGRPAVAVLVFDVPGLVAADLPPHDGVAVRPRRDLPRRRLVAVHLPPGLDWYAGQELPDAIATSVRMLT